MPIIITLTDNFHKALDTHPIETVGVIFIAIIFIACAVTGLQSRT